MNPNVIEVELNDVPISADAEEVVDFVVAEDEEEEVEELPISVESCILLNNVYIESIDEMKQFLVSKRRENESRQTELKNNSNLKVVRDVTINNFGYSHPNSLIPFMAPYFKDVKGLTAPYNGDTIQKRTKGEINQSYVGTNKPWNVIERQRLKDILHYDTAQRLHKPLRDEKEKLTKDRSNLRSNMQRIAELTEQIDDLNSVDPHELPAPDRWDPNLDWLKFATELDTDHNADDCELYWNNFLHPSINKNEWTKEEDQKLKSLVHLYGMHDWERVALELGTNRMGWQCCSRYQSELNRDIKRIGPLTKAEAELVEKVIEQCRVGDFIPWHQVKYFIEGRTLPQIKHYWNKINVPKRGDQWNEDENRQLLLAVKKYGTHNWRKVSQFLPGRSNRQCRERYMMRLNFGNDRKLGDWTPLEDKQILELAPLNNFKWVKLEEHIKGRNARQIASRYDLLLRHNSKERGNKRTKIRKSNIKSNFVTRSLTVKNKLYERIRHLLNRGQNKDIDQQLRIGKQKLTQRLEMELQGIPIPSNKGRPKKSNAEENLETKIIDIFAAFDVKSSPKKIINRSPQDQCVFQTTKHIFSELIKGEPFPSETDLAKAIRLLIDRAITSRPKSNTLVPIPGPSTSTASNNLNLCPPILPPNRATVKGLRGLLIHTDYFSQIIAKSEISLEEMSNVLKNNQNYGKLFEKFRSLFYWPALLSMIEPPEKQIPEPQPKTSGRALRSKQRKNSWLKTDSSRMVEIRTNQKNLIQTEMERNSKNKIEDIVNDKEDEPLDIDSKGAAWYVDHKHRKYYSMKSLDPKSFVYTRIKEKHDVIPQTETQNKRRRKTNKNSELNESSTEEEVQQNGVSDSESDSEKRKPIKKRKKISKGDEDFSIRSTLLEEKIHPKRTGVETRRSARIRLK